MSWNIEESYLVELGGKSFFQIADKILQYYRASHSRGQQIL